MTAAAWTPSEQESKSSRLWEFLTRHGFSSYPELCQKAAAQPEWFWDALVKELGVPWSRPYERVMDISAGAPFTRWFVGGTLNAFDHAVNRFAKEAPERLAISAENERGDRRQLTFAQLESDVERAAAGLRSIGVSRGVAVGIYLPLVPENAIALLACTKLGAIVVPLFSGFGSEAIRQRLSDAQARVLISADGAIRRNRPVAMKPVGDGTAAGLRQPDTGGDRRPLRRGGRLPGPGPDLVSGRAPPGHAPRPVPHRGPGVDARRRAVAGALPAGTAARARLHRRALDTGGLALALRKRRPQTAPDHELLRCHGIRRRNSRRQFHDTLQALQLCLADPGRGRCGFRRAGPARPGEGRRAGHSATLPWDDHGVLAGPGALPGGLLVALAGHLGPRRLGPGRRGWVLVHPRPV